MLLKPELTTKNSVGLLLQAILSFLAKAKALDVSTAAGLRSFSWWEHMLNKLAEREDHSTFAPLSLWVRCWLSSQWIIWKPHSLEATQGHFGVVFPSSLICFFPGLKNLCHAQVSLFLFVGLFVGHWDGTEYWILPLKSFLWSDWALLFCVLIDQNHLFSPVYRLIILQVITQTVFINSCVRRLLLCSHFLFSNHFLWAALLMAHPLINPSAQLVWDERRTSWASEQLSTVLRICRESSCCLTLQATGFLCSTVHSSNG